MTISEYDLFECSTSDGRAGVGNLEIGNSEPSRLGGGLELSPVGDIAPGDGDPQR